MKERKKQTNRPTNKQKAKLIDRKNVAINLPGMVEEQWTKRKIKAAATASRRLIFDAYLR